MTKHFILYLALLLFACQLSAQKNTTLAHSHNDYLNEIPFLMAYHHKFESIEVDIWEKDGNLYVAHEYGEIVPGRTIDSLYLNPVVQTFSRNKNKAWPDRSGTYQLLVDIKGDPGSALALLCRKIEKHREAFDPLLNANAIRIVVTGNMPDPGQFGQYPLYIGFDGRTDIRYSAEQLQRVALFSEDLKRFTQWNGKGSIPVDDKKRLVQLIDSIHALGKKVRFWNTADHINAWKSLMDIGTDYLNTDRISALANYLGHRSSSVYNGGDHHLAYRPTYKSDNKKGKIENVILMIGDGMGVSQLYAGYTGNRADLSIFAMRRIGFSKTSSVDSYNTDSAAGGTALATGQKTYNRHIGCDSTRQPIRNIPEIIDGKGIWSGIVTVGDATDATPAVFYAHQSDRNMSEKIALDFLDSPVRVLIGGNKDAFINRSDNRNLLDELGKDGFTASLDLYSVPDAPTSKLVVLDDVNTRSKMDGRGDFLADASVKAIDLLKRSPKGFFLMVEGTQIDWGGHFNSMPYVVREVIDFDKAVGEALKFADSNGKTLVVVTADHECGGLTLLDGNYREGTVDGQFSTNDHTGIMVPVFAYGPRSSEFCGVYENVDVFDKIIKLLKANLSKQ
ncbi:MAG: alkaline phosphatase [Breznakibacter sp.]